MSLNGLNPGDMNYYDTKGDNVYERFLRYEIMIKLIEAYETGNLKPVKYVYEQWKEVYGDSYKNVLSYDDYDGEVTNIKYHFRQMINSEYNVETYINDYSTSILQSTVIPKEDVYGIIGFMTIQIDEKYLLNSHGNLDKMMQSVPLDYSQEDVSNWFDYEKDYNRFIDGVMVKMEVVDREMVAFTMNDLLSEFVGQVYKVDENLYMYMDYYGELKDGNIVQGDVLAKVMPYKIEYYMK
jgi:hypothetical protein